MILCYVQDGRGGVWAVGGRNPGGAGTSMSKRGAKMSAAMTRFSRGHVLRRDGPDEAAAAALERVRVGARERSAAGRVQHLCGNQPVRRVHPTILH